MTTGPQDQPGFRAVYAEPGIYDQVLLPHGFGGISDDELVWQLLREHYGPPPAEPAEPRLRMVEFGCGTGRVTGHLAPYARRLLGVDNSPAMTAAFAARFPAAETRTADTAAALTALHREGAAGSVDVVGAFWSLSYPIGACVETLTAEGIRPVPDPEDGRRRAAALVDALVGLLAPGGHLLALFFDAESPEQRLVTRAWETIAPTPFGDRGYALQILTGALQAAEHRGDGRLRRRHLTGSAVATDPAAARRWFTAAHFKDLPALTGNPALLAEVDALIAESTRADGTVHLPAGVHVIDFHRAPTATPATAAAGVGTADGSSWAGRP